MALTLSDKFVHSAEILPERGIDGGIPSKLNVWQILLSLLEGYTCFGRGR